MKEFRGRRVHPHGVVGSRAAASRMAQPLESTHGCRSARRPLHRRRGPSFSRRHSPFHDLDPAGGAAGSTPGTVCAARRRTACHSASVPITRWSMAVPFNKSAPGSFHASGHRIGVQGAVIDLLSCTTRSREAAYTRTI